jgi:hypothetical protein
MLVYIVDRMIATDRVLYIDVCNYTESGLMHMPNSTSWILAEIANSPTD